MKDYISREAAIKAIQGVPSGNWNNARYVHELQDIPGADVVPLMRAIWIWDNYYYDYKCSHCNFVPRRKIDQDKPFDFVDLCEFGFCSRCGAKMTLYDGLHQPVRGTGDDGWMIISVEPKR